MITTTTMVKLGKVQGNKMVDMQLSNNKLVDRGVRMIMDETGAERNVAEQLLNEYGSVRKAVDNYRANS
jgi:N-acetylmuramic acid 6-phosphate etherase